VVFQNFGSKPALFTAVLERAAEEAGASLAHAAAGFGSAGALLAHVLGHAPGDHGQAAQAAQAASPAGHRDQQAVRGGLFAVAVALAADPAAPELRGPVLRTLAGHLADIVRRGQQDGSVRADIEPEPAGWLLVSLLAAAPLRRAGLPAGLEPAVTELAGRLLSSGGHRPGSVNAPGPAA
jgi:AcrR family transcriptional regulator